MIDFIKNKVEKIMFECCNKYAASKKVKIEDIQLILGVENNENTYTMCENYVKKDKYDIMQVLGVKIDFLGYSKLAPPFILKSLYRFSEEQNIPLDKVNVMVVPSQEKNKSGKVVNSISLYLYNGEQYVPYIQDGIENDSISLSELFREEDFEMPTQ